MRLRREWADFVDPESDHWVYRIDVTLMASGYECIWGKGCEGIYQKGEKGNQARMGCCSLSFVAEDEDDLARITKRVGELTEEEWQFKKLGDVRWLKNPPPRGVNVNGRVHRGGCIFHNREGFAGGEGCAFHIAALNRGESPIEWKPVICWQMPLHVEEIEDQRVTVIRFHEDYEWSWYPDPDEPVLDWWCGNDKRAWGHRVPFYRRHEEMLVKIMGKQVFAALEDYMIDYHPMRVPAESVPVEIRKR